jgi:hypothetical protein
MTFQGLARSNLTTENKIKRLMEMLDSIRVPRDTKSVVSVLVEKPSCPNCGFVNLNWRQKKCACGQKLSWIEYMRKLK